MTIGALFTLFLAVIGGLAVGMTWLTHVWVRSRIGGKHRALEEIHMTNRPPASWTARYDRKLRALERDGRAASEPSVEAGRAFRFGPAQAGKWKRRRQRKVVAELERLIAYTKRTRLIAEEEVREVLLDDLAALLVKWKGDPDDGRLPPNDPSPDPTASPSQDARPFASADVPASGNAGPAEAAAGLCAAERPAEHFDVNKQLGRPVRHDIQ